MENSRLKRGIKFSCRRIKAYFGASEFMDCEGQTSSAKIWAGIVDPENYTGQVKPEGVMGDRGGGSCDRKPGEDEVLLLKMKCSQGSGFGVGGKMVATGEV